MKSKETYVLVGALVLILILVGWGLTSDKAEDTDNDATKEAVSTTTTTTTKSNKTNSIISKPKISVNPVVIQEKPIPVVPTAKNLAGLTFRLATYNGVALAPDTELTLSFTESSLTLKFCNTMGSNYYIVGNTIRTANVVASTQMYCSSPQNIMKIESDASLMLNSSITMIYRSGSTLILSNAQGIVMAFEGF